MLDLAPTVLRWGVLSTARIADDVIPGLHRSERNELVACASRSEEAAQRFAERYGIPRGYGSYEELLSDRDVDCVYICLPNGLHQEWVEQALLSGKNVLCEKPLTARAEDARRLFDIAADRQLVLAEAFMYRHHPKTLALRDVVRSGRLGEVQTIRSHFGFMTTDPASDVRFQPALDGGSLLDVGVYCVNLSNFLMDDEPTTVTAHAVVHASGVDERFYGTLTYAAGAVAQFDCGMLSNLHLGVSVLGSQGEATVAMPWYAHHDPQSIELKLADGSHEVIACPGENSYFLETEDFARVVLDGGVPVVPPEETLRTLRTVARLRQAAGL